MVYKCLTKSFHINYTIIMLQYYCLTNKHKGFVSWVRHHGHFIAPSVNILLKQGPIKRMGMANSIDLACKLYVYLALDNTIMYSKTIKACMQETSNYSHSQNNKCGPSPVLTLGYQVDHSSLHLCCCSSQWSHLYICRAGKIAWVNVYVMSCTTCHVY